LELVEATDYANATSSDRIIGLAGLVSVLCRFEEYRGHTTALRRAADRILELKTFEYKGHVLWKTLPDTPRLLSGAGHGMAGIAEALIAASDLLGDDRYLPAAAEALDYELEAHQRYAYKFGTWADLRDFPPKRYMHGYCAGAPGTGIMLNRLHAAGLGDERTRALAELVRTSVDQLPLNSYDHLCCGNAALAEYRLSSGDAQGAARVLASIRAHALDADAARGPHGSNVTASLFNGISGMGYEMLRYAYPHETLSVL
jgi:lantibiotic modifying enzyme